MKQRPTIKLTQVDLRQGSGRAGRGGGSEMKTKPQTIIVKASKEKAA